jgi:hypothetical protein
MPRIRSWLQVSILILALLYSPVFAADLHPPAATIPATYFGLHMHHLFEPTPTPWPSVPVPTWRLWDAGNVNWWYLEPSKGQWQFATLDRYVSLAQEHHSSVLLNLGNTPAWASPAQHPNAPPANIEDWRAHVRAVATRYKGRIQAYEIWNEPNIRDFWSGTPEQLVVLTREAYQIIHSVDPQAIVVSPSATAAYGIPWLQEFLEKGGGQYVDVIGFHFYVDPHTLAPEDMVPLIEQVHELLKANGVDNKPLWNTESGWLPPAKFDSDELAAGVLARAYVLAWAAGVQRFYWYAWDNRLMAIVTYREAEHKITPAGSAFGIMQEWLVGAQMDVCTENSEHDWTCELNRSGKKEWIVWNPKRNRKFNVPETWQVKSVTPLLQDRYSLNGSSIDIGPVPVLLKAHS